MRLFQNCSLKKKHISETALLKNAFSKSLSQKYFKNCSLKKYVFEITPPKNTFSKLLF